MQLRNVEKLGRAATVGTMLADTYEVCHTVVSCADSILTVLRRGTNQISFAHIADGHDIVGGY